MILHNIGHSVKKTSRIRSRTVKGLVSVSSRSRGWTSRVSSRSRPWRSRQHPWSTQNVHALLFALRTPECTTFPEFIQLLDDDIVSVTALMQIVNPKGRHEINGICVTQLALSVYLMTQCQLKLRHSVMSLAQTLSYIKFAQRNHSADCTLDQLTLKFIGRKVLIHLRRFYSDITVFPA